MITATVIVLYIVAAIMCAYVVGFRIRRKVFDFWGGVAAGTAYFIIVPISLVIIEGELPPPIDFFGSNIPAVFLDKDGGEVALVFLSIICALIYPVFVGKVRRLVAPTMTFDVSVKVLIGAYLILSVGIFSFAGLGDEGAHWYESKEEFLVNYGLAGVLASYILSALKITAFVLVTNEFLNKKISLAHFFLGAMLVSAIDLYTTGNRIFTLLVVVLVFLSLLRSKRYGLVSILILAAAPFAYAMSLFRWIRSYMHSEGAGSLESSINGFVTGVDFALNQATNITAQQIIGGATESVNVNVLVSIFGDFGHQVDFLYGESLLKLIVFWVPRSLWAEKPDSIAVVIGQHLAPGQGVALIATFYGEMFANFGYFSFLLGVLFLLLAKRILDFYFKDYEIHGALSFLFGFLLIRMPYSDVILVAVCVGLMVRYGGDKIVLNSHKDFHRKKFLRN
jgi:hypothetical protein